MAGQFKQEEAHQLAVGDGIVIICGRFEGIDQRIIESRQLKEVSIGDYVLSGGGGRNLRYFRYNYSVNSWCVRESKLNCKRKL